jgi:glycosyltransferase involved in cell wall biosynthesis
MVQRLIFGARLRLRYAREFLTFDSRVFQHLAASAGVVLSLVLLSLGKRARAFAGLTAVHRANWSSMADRVAEKYVRRELAASKISAPGNVIREFVSGHQPTPGTRKFFDNPMSLLGSKMIVLKSPAGANEKGMVLIDYSFALPVVAKFFDLARISAKYHIVTEPSWSGYCDFNVLCCGTLDTPVFVQAFEPRDAALLTAMQANFIPIGTSANWWVDHRVMTPLPDVRKERDIIMIASWARFKRHARFFAALSKLRARGHRLTVSLLGYPIDCSMRDIAAEAAYYGVADQLEFFEHVPPDQVNYQLNRARINVMWSRREGVNRAIIEGMFANVPCILREGFNYGYHYPYVNQETGRFATEDTLPDTILELLDRDGAQSPRDWVMNYMSCQRATEIIATGVRDVALARGEAWTRDPVVKVCHLDTMMYWNQADRARFEGDYAFLRSSLRRPS